VLKVLQNIVLIAVPFEVFEEAVRVLTRDPNSLAHHILHGLKPNAKFEGSMFIKFLFNYLLSLRAKMWSPTDAGSEGLYAVSRALSSMLRAISHNHSRAQDQWAQLLTKETTAALLTIDKLKMDEADVVLSLVPGGEFGAITAGDPALTSNDETVTILGYSSTWTPTEQLSGKSKADVDAIIAKLRLYPELSGPKQKAVALFFDKANKSRQEMMLLHPSSLSVLPSLDADQAPETAKASPLMDPVVAKYLIDVLLTDKLGAPAEQGDHRQRQS
jgi:hypothetical protein